MKKVWIVMTGMLLVVAAGSAWASGARALKDDFRVEEILGLENMYDNTNVDLIHHLDVSLKSKELYELKGMAKMGALRENVRRAAFRVYTKRTSRRR